MEMKKQVINIIFDAGKGDVALASREAVTGEAFGVLPRPKRSGYRFVGWQLNGELIGEDTVLLCEEDITLVAQWEKSKAAKKKSSFKQQTLAIVILSSVLVIVALVSLISSYARSVKEATTYVSPFMILVMLLGVITMFSSGKLPTVAYLIPLFNSVNCISSIFGGGYSVTEIALTAVSNLAVMGLLTYALTLMFNSERMITDKS